MRVAGESHSQPVRGGGAPLVGRAFQLRILAEYLAHVRAGCAQVVLISGAPGIGKTRLIDQFLAISSATTTVLRGGSSLAQGMPPCLHAQAEQLEAILDVLSSPGSPEHDPPSAAAPPR
jgi:hypothetical protein